MSVGENIEKVRERIKRVAEAVGRDFREIVIVAVTKTVDVEQIKEAISFGLNIFGESRVQEAKQKYRELGDKVVWHLVGHLQRNKAKDAVRIFDVIHSLDSEKLAQEIDRQAKKIGKIQTVLVEVNVSGEESKYGVSVEEVIPFIRRISILPNLKVKGLMTVAPLSECQEHSRPHFRKLREISQAVKKENIGNVEMTWLSMGMSNDFEVAIEEGSNMVRIGRAIFASQKEEK